MITREVDKDGNVRYYDSRRDLHRTDGPAVELTSGARSWYLHGELHRTDGPAIERADGSREWWLNGEPHRSDGPATEYADGSCEWWLNSRQYTFAEWLGKAAQTDEHRTLLIIQYSDNREA